MEPAPPAVPEPRPRRPCLACCGAALGAILLVALVAVVGWFPFIDWFAARSDARARAHVQALVDEGLPVTLDALEEPPARDAGPLLDALLARLAVTKAEEEALQRELEWRDDPTLWPDPNRPPPDPDGDGAVEESPDSDGPRWDAPRTHSPEQHPGLVARALARLDAETPALDEALACDGWRFPVRGFADPPRGEVVTWIDLKELLDARAFIRGGAACWADLVRRARLIELARDPTIIGVLVHGGGAAYLGTRIEQALGRYPLEPAAVARLDRGLQAIERPDVLSIALRCDALRTLSYYGPDRASFDHLEEELKKTARSPAGIFTGFQRPAASPLWPLRFVAYLDDRARWARLLAEQVRAARLPRREALARLEALAAEGKASQGVLSSFLTEPRTLDRLTRDRADARLARMALAWAVAAGAGPLPPTPPLLLHDPFVEPSAPLRWRRDGDRAFTLWSVGADGVEAPAATPDEEDTPEKDPTFQVTLSAG